MEARVDVPDEKVIYMHGFTREELMQLHKLIQTSVEDKKAIAYCTTTKNNLDMTLRQLIHEVRKDHNYMVHKKGSPEVSP